MSNESLVELAVFPFGALEDEFSLLIRLAETRRDEEERELEAAAATAAAAATSTSFVLESFEYALRLGLAKVSPLNAPPLIDAASLGVSICGAAVFI